MVHSVPRSFEGEAPGDSKSMLRDGNGLRPLPEARHRVRVVRFGCLTTRFFAWLLRDRGHLNSAANDLFLIEWSSIVDRHGFAARFEGALPPFRLRK